MKLGRAGHSQFEIRTSHFAPVAERAFVAMRLAQRLPRKESFFTVLRDAMDIDELPSPALYFGTTTGQLWIGRDGGER